MFNLSWMEGAVQAILSAVEQSGEDGQVVIDRCLARFEALLTIDPLNFGESREGPLRVGFWHPCAISFVVDDPTEGEVRVLDFWLTRRV